MFCVKDNNNVATEITLLQKNMVVLENLAPSENSPPSPNSKAAPPSAFEISKTFVKLNSVNVLFIKYSNILPYLCNRDMGR